MSRSPFAAVIRSLLIVSLVTATLAGITPSGARASDGDIAALQRTWARTDGPVVAGITSRTWMWGPALTGALQEEARDVPGGLRTVQYFDKSRMEIATDPDADPTSIWYVTNGLLAREMVTGQMQIGASEFEPRQPASVNVAGDPDDPGGPTYASFELLLDAEPIPNGWLVTQRVDRAGTVADDPSLATYGVTAHVRVTEPGIDHQVASVFWEFMTASGTVVEGTRYISGPLFQNPFYATGYPIAEPYWASVRVGGTRKDVLIQVFERRVLTWTPDNPAGWRVEAGNVGRHYYEWRYGELPSEPGPPMFDPSVMHDHMDDLLLELQSVMAWWDGHNAVSVTDLQTGRTISVNGDRPQPAACTIKIPLMMAVSQDIEAGLYTHDSISDLVLRTMGPSTTPPARELIRIVGGGSIEDGIHRINRIMQDNGMQDSVLMHPPGYDGEEYGYAALWGRKDNLLTTNDLNRLLSALYHRQALSPQATDYVLWSMTLGTPGQQLSLGGPLPSSATLYHKIGLIYEPYNTWNDAGIVVFESNGRQYAYAISWLGSFSDGWLTAHDRGAVVSRIAWRALSAHYSHT